MEIFDNVALASRLQKQEAKARSYFDALRELWEEAQKLYARTTWNGWVDHGKTHIGNVIKILDKMIPPTVLARLTSEQIFVLLGGAMLHDIGMAPRGNLNLNEIRRRHGAFGARIIQEKLAHRFPDGQSLRRTCEVVKNHHGDFKPQEAEELALLVRLADGLDFGPGRAARWVFDLIQPPEDQIKYWTEHLQLDPPRIDNELLRVEVTGTIADDRFIASLRENFEQSNHARLQGTFFGGGLSQKTTRAGTEKSYVIIDKTTKVGETGVDPKKGLIRPASFSNEDYLVAARSLYNIGQYEAARTCFADIVHKIYKDRWTERPCNVYLYHYLQTLNKLGLYQDMLRRAGGLNVASLAMENRASVLIACGIAHLRLGHIEDALVSFQRALDNYMRLPPDDHTRKVNEPDSRTWLGITRLEHLRMKIDLGRNISRESEELGRDIEYVAGQYNEYRETRPVGTHYEGRFFGLRAFYDLLDLDVARKSHRAGSTLDAPRWNSALDNAQRAYGGDRHENRVPFGVMSGKYCEVAVNWHKYKYCSDKNQRSQALSQCVRSLVHVLRSYAEIYGDRPITWIWDRISFLTRNVELAWRHMRPTGTGGLVRQIGSLKGMLPPVPRTKAQIFTPLN